MYLEHFSLNERPFSISPDPRFLFMSNRYREALTHLTYGVQEGGGFVLLTGEVGTGKTTVCRCLLQQLPDNTRLAFVLNPKLNSVELLATICDELNVTYPENCTSLKILTDKLTEYLVECFKNNLTVVVMIDEAQNLATEVLEQIRLLTNLETNQKKLLQIVLVGQPELQEKLAQRDLRQLAQRITARYHLRPLNLKETMAYVLHRTRIAGSHKALFSRLSIEHLHTKTQGIPRLINTICDRALLAASSRHKNHVDKKIMTQAVKEIMGSGFSRDTESSASQWSWPTLKPFALSFAGGLLLFFAYWLGQSTTRTDELNNDNPSQQKILAKGGSNSSATKENENSIPSVASKSDSDSGSSIQNGESLVDLLIGDQRWDTNGNFAFENLLEQWRLEYSPFKHGDACQYAETYGLFCHSDFGNWQSLREFNRPVILKFSAGLQGEFWGMLKSLKGTQATILIGSKETTMSIESLTSIWTGEFKLVWQVPIGYQGDLKIGDEGDAVIWLSESLNQLTGEPLAPNDRFDNALQTKLMAFQQQQNITADGIAGMKTILKINSQTMNGIPMLNLLN